MAGPELYSTFSVETLAAVSWRAPDPLAGGAAPPRDLTVSGSTIHSQEPFATNGGIGSRIIGYNVYRSNTPNVTVAPGNLFASVGASQTSVVAPISAGGSFFVVTASYANGEGSPSNESGAVRAPGGTITEPLKVTGTRLVATGSGFTDQVTVFVDGIPFLAQATVESGSRVVQTGDLIIGVPVRKYVRSGTGAIVTIRNGDGGTVRTRYTP